MLTKQGIDVSFAKGLDTKSDPKRVAIGNFLQLQNTVFNKGGLLQKRNGYGLLAPLPDTSYSYLTTFNGNLTAIGPNIAAFNSAGAGWVPKGSIQSLSVNTLPVIRNNLNQTACDVTVATNGLACAVYLESDGSATTAKYVVFDSMTGQNIAAPAPIPVGSGVVTGGLRVFTLGNAFVLIFTNVIAATSHLQYVRVDINDPTNIGANTDIASAYVAKTTLSWDAAVANNTLFIAYNTTTGGQAINVVSLTSSFILSAAVSFAGRIATMVSVTADVSNPVSIAIWVSFYDLAGGTGYSLSVDESLRTLVSPQQFIFSGNFSNITSAAQGGICTVFIEKNNVYSYDSAILTNFITKVEVDASGPVVIGNSVRSVGLASKATIVDGTIYFLVAYASSYQTTYFLINGSTSLESAPVIAAKLAYSNGGGYLLTGLPSISVNSDVIRVGYLFKDLIQAVNKNTNVTTGTQVDGIFSQTGINLASFEVGTELLDTSEIGSDLHISGGFLWMYDGYLPVEHLFFLWPDMDTSTPTNAASWSATGGSIAAKPDGTTNANAYYYQVTYEWTDNQGNAFRSAPSIPIGVTTTGSGSAGSITINIPTLRLTMKTANPIKIVIYRWSVAQENYYQVTSITSPTLNSTTSDSITYVDTLADATILGNNLIYTTGGVLENIAAPATKALALFDSRLWGINAEDENSLWFSKQVLPNTPVETSDLLTLYVTPTLSSDSSLGPNKTIYPMDDKLIIGKKNAFVYVNGTGPDSTGANNQYSEPIFITSTVGCDNQKSIVLTPRGLVFQSDKGIWLLARSLETSYIGAPVEEFTLGATVLSAVNVPETNQIRFTLDTGITLMYDYFYDQWGTFYGVPCISSCIFENMHTFINSYGATYQETPGSYLDGSNPVLIKFQTGPLRIGDLQNYQRAYFFYILGTYISPHKLMVSITYDYDTAPSQSMIISPDNYSTPYGSGSSQSPYGQGSPYGGPGNAENWRVFLERQRCMAFGITIQEIFDASKGASAGGGLTISGLNVVCAFKKAYRPQPNAQSVG